MNYEMRNKCYECIYRRDLKCIYRRDLTWWVHSECVSPNVQDMEVKGNEHGIKKGWFHWPYNFDPVWLEKCNGFKERGIK